MNTCLVFVLCVLVCQTIEAKKKKHKEIKSESSVYEFKFSYDKNADDGPSKWAKTYPACCGSRQSPIELDIFNLTQKKMPKLIWSPEYKKAPQKMDLYVLNHDLVLESDYGSGNAIISGGPLKSTYYLDRIAFHWGSEDGRGSLHASAPGEFYDMEINAGFINEKYKTAEELLNNADGMAVIAYLVKKKEPGNPIFDMITGNSPSIDKVGTRVPLAQLFALDKLLPEFKIFMTYEGSIPRPPCSEDITWIISEKILSISESQLDKFRKLSRVDKELLDNVRPIQPKNCRPVYYGSS